VRIKAAVCFDQETGQYVEGNRGERKILSEEEIGLLEEGKKFITGLKASGWTAKATLSQAKGGSLLGAIPGNKKVSFTCLRLHTDMKEGKGLFPLGGGKRGGRIVHEKRGRGRIRVQNKDVDDPWRDALFDKNN